MANPLMPKATAVWLIDNTTLTFKQVADFCGLHTLEVKGIADGDVAGVGRLQKPGNMKKRRLAGPHRAGHHHVAHIRLRNGRSSLNIPISVS